MQPYGNDPQSQYQQQGYYPPQQQGYYPPQQQGYYPPQQQGYYHGQQQGYPEPQQQARHPSAAKKLLGGAAFGGGLALAVTALTGGIGLLPLAAIAGGTAILNTVRPRPDGKNTRFTGFHKRGFFGSTFGNGFRGALLGGLAATAILIATGGIAAPLAIPIIGVAALGVGGLNAAGGAARWSWETGKNLGGGGRKAPPPGYGPQQSFEGRVQSIERGIGGVESIVAAVGGLMGVQSLLSKFGGGAEKKAEAKLAASRARDPLAEFRQENGQYAVTVEALAREDVFSALKAASRDLHKSGQLTPLDALRGIEPVSLKDGVVSFTPAQLANGQNLKAIEGVHKEASGINRSYERILTSQQGDVARLENTILDAHRRGKNDKVEVGHGKLEERREVIGELAKLREAELADIRLPGGLTAEPAVQQEEQAGYKPRHAASGPADAPSQAAPSQPPVDGQPLTRRQLREQLGSSVADAAHGAVDSVNGVVVKEAAGQASTAAPASPSTRTPTREQQQTAAR